MVFFGVSCLAGDDDHTRHLSALCALIRTFWIMGRRVQTHAVPSAKMLPAREVARKVQQNETG